MLLGLWQHLTWGMFGKFVGLAAYHRKAGLRGLAGLHVWLQWQPLISVCWLFVLTGVPVGNVRMQEVGLPACWDDVA